MSTEYKTCGQNVKICAQVVNNIDRIINTSTQCKYVKGERETCTPRLVRVPHLGLHPLLLERKAFVHPHPHTIGTRLVLQPPKNQPCPNHVKVWMDNTSTHNTTQHHKHKTYAVSHVLAVRSLTRASIIQVRVVAFMRGPGRYQREYTQDCKCVDGIQITSTEYQNMSTDCR